MSRNTNIKPYTHFAATRVSTLLVPTLAFSFGFFIMFSQDSLNLAPVWAGYLSLAVLAGIDSVIGGVRAGIDGKFHSDVFLSGFAVNTVVAVALAWFGDAIGIQDVYLAAVVVFAWRIFLNISMIRRSYLERARASRAIIESILAERSMDALPGADPHHETKPGTDVIGA